MVTIIRKYAERLDSRYNQINRDTRINVLQSNRIFMGVVCLCIAIGVAIAAAAAAAAAKITADMVDDLKRQINSIVDQHKPDVDKLKAFQALLEKLDMSKVYEVMKNVSENMSGNFKTFLADQAERIKTIKDIRIKDLDKDPLTGIFGELMQMLNIIGNELLIIEIATATNPATIVLSGVMALLSGILSIFSTVQNIMAINELKKKKEDLIEYFKPGGKFEEAQRKLKDSAIDVTQNLYLLIFNGKNLLKTLSVRIMLIQLEGKTDIDYGKYLRILQEDYFDPGFEKLVFDTYTNLIDVNNDPQLQLGPKISRMYTILDHMMSAQDIPKKLQNFTNVLKQFTQDTPIAKIMDKKYDQMHKLNQSRIAFEKRFDIRKGRTVEQLQATDKMLLRSMHEESNFPEGTSEQKKQLLVAELTSFFTVEFYGDDQSGKTLYGHNLQELQKSTRMLEYVDAFSMSNAFLLPQPVEGPDKVDWNVKKDKLFDEYMKVYKGVDKPFVQSVYMRMENQKKTIAGEQIVVLKLYYGIVMKIRGDIAKHEMTIEDLTRALTHADIIQARIQTYLTVENITKVVTNPIFVQGVEHVIDGKLGTILYYMNYALKFVFLLPKKWKEFKIGNKTIQELAKNFTGLSINLREIKFESTQLHLKDDSIPITTNSFVSQNLTFVCSQIILFINGECKPWRVESISVIKSGDKYEGKVGYSDSSTHENFLGKTLNQITINSANDLNTFATKLRDKKRQLFLITVSSSEDVICWFME